MILKIFKWMFSKFGYTLISSKSYDNEQKMHHLLSSKYQEEVRTLVFKPDSVKAMEIKSRYKMEKDLERMIWMGVPIVIDKNKNIHSVITNPPLTT